MLNQTIVMAITLVATLSGCRSRDPGIRDTATVSATRAALDTGTAVPAAESSLVPNDKPVASADKPRVDSATKTDSTVKPLEKLPVQTPPAPAKAITRFDSSPKGSATVSSPAPDTAKTSTTVTSAPVAVVVPPASPAAEPARPALPFAPGEQLEYQVKFGSVSVGKAVMEVIGVDTVRGIPALHIRLRVEGKLAFVSVKDLYESWIDTRTMSSLRYTQDIDEANYERERHYEIYPERKTYHEQGKKELPSVAAPLDDASFLFFLRTIPLVVGQTLSFDRYFKPDRNPVKASVMRKERITVPAGKFETIVIRPVIKTSGLFSEGGRAEVWFADDESRILVQLKTQMKVGSLNLFLRKIKRAER